MDTSAEIIGTATTILRLGPFTVLTDPNFLHRGQRAYLGHGLWTKRLTEPSRQPADLPEIDAVLLSHLHGDHFDRVARRELAKDLPVLTTPPAARRLRRWGFAAAQGLQTWESTVLTRGDWRLTVTAAPGVHGPGPVRHALPTVMGSVLELSRAGGPDEGSERGEARVIHRTYVSGDTLCRPWLRDVRDRTGPLDAAVLHLGGTRVLGIMVTMDGVQGADLAELLQPGVTVPVHHDDYGVFRSPVGDFVTQWQERSVGGVLRLGGRGDTVSLVPDPGAAGSVER